MGDDGSILTSLQLPQNIEDTVHYLANRIQIAARTSTQDIRTRDYVQNYPKEIREAVHLAVE